MTYTLLATLCTAGLNREDVNILTAGPAGVWQIFADGKADAMAGAADWVVNVQETGKQITLMPREKMFNAMSQAVIASDNAIENDPELVRAIVQGSLRALQDIASDPDQAAKDFAAAVPGYAHREDSVRSTFDLYLERIWATSTPGVIDPQRMQTSVDFFLKKGLIRREEPLEHNFTNQFLAK